MKRYCLKGLLLIIIVCVLAGTAFLLSAKEPFRTILMYATNSEEYDNEPSEEIISYIREVQENSDYTKLIVGDSVCHQLFISFQKYNEVYCTVGSNQAVTMIGHYLLIREFLESHPQTTDVYLVLSSVTGTGLDSGELAYQYLVIPFSETGLLQNVSEQTKEDLKYKYGEFFTKPEVIQFINHSPVAKKLYLNSYTNVEYDSIIMSFEYFGLIMKLCKERDINLYLLHSPMQESSREIMQQERERNLAACTSDSMRYYIERYYESIVYYPDSFFSDGVHFGPDYREEFQLAGYVRTMMEKEQTLSDFALQP